MEVIRFNTIKDRIAQAWSQRNGEDWQINELLLDNMLRLQLLTTSDLTQGTIEEILDRVESAELQYDRNLGLGFGGNPNKNEGMEIPLSGNAILNALDHKVNMDTYRELYEKNSIDEILGPHQACVILYETTQGFGHWVCIFRNKEGIQFFDSLGMKPDQELKHVDTDYRYLDIPRPGKKGPFKWWIPHLSALLLKAYMEGEDIIYNEYIYQKTAEDIQTCGKHVIYRLLNKELSNDEYHDLVMGESKEKGITPDELVNLKYRELTGGDGGNLDWGMIGGIQIADETVQQLRDALITMNIAIPPFRIKEILNLAEEQGFIRQKDISDLVSEENYMDFQDKLLKIARNLRTNIIPNIASLPFPVPDQGQMGVRQLEPKRDISVHSIGHGIGGVDRPPPPPPIQNLEAQAAQAAQQQAAQLGQQLAQQALAWQNNNRVNNANRIFQRFVNEFQGITNQMRQNFWDGMVQFFNNNPNIDAIMANNVNLPDATINQIYGQVLGAVGAPF